MQYKKYGYRFYCLLPFACFFLPVQAQQTVKYDRCGTMQVLALALKKDPNLKTKLEQRELRLQQAIKARGGQNQREQAITAIIPVVFHIVLSNPNLVTDQQILDQLEVLNNDFAGKNSDSTQISPAFKPLFGKSGIQFTLAQRTPDDEPGNGIERVVASKSSYTTTDTSLKYTALGGADAWDPDRYLNIWICNLSNGILGYGTIPGSSTPLQEGVAVLYSSLPGNIEGPYNLGRTLTHEAGHFFNLYHIWGDDGGGCSGSDFIDDTPNQSDATYGCPGVSVQTDDCATSSPGKLYQDYMDYTDDACMHLFTKQQAVRMEAALSVLRTSLLTSNAAQPVVLKNLDAELKAILEPVNRVCSTAITPVITLRNKGVQVLTSATIFASIDGGTVITNNWTGSLNSLTSTTVTLQSMTITEGKHQLQVVVFNPNGSNDQDITNDTVTTTFEYYAPVSPPFTESFENSTFPPQGWDIVNADKSYSWERVTGIAKTGNASVVMRNYRYQSNDLKDYLRLPLIQINSGDSAYLTFQLAAGAQTNTSTRNNVWDTLEVLISTDCGKTYTSLYKKWGASLVTRSSPVTTEFAPASTEWRKDSVNLTGYINAGPFMLAFLNTTEFENNIYLDDIAVTSTVINPNLRERGFLVTPNPTSGRIQVQFYPNPANLEGIYIYNATGQRIMQATINGSTSYSFDLSRYSNGVYIVQAVFNNKKVTAKVFKNN